MDAAAQENTIQPTQDSSRPCLEPDKTWSSEGVTSSSVPQQQNTTSYAENGSLNSASVDHRVDTNDGQERKLVHAFDVLGDRSKRRKVSQEPDEQVLEASSTPSVSAKEVPGGSSVAPTQVTSQTPVSIELESKSPPVATPSTPKRRRGRPPKSTPDETQKTLQPNIAKQSQDGSILDDGGQKQRTPRKKTMQISASGKLFEEPAKLQPFDLPKKELGQRPKPAQTSKNLKLKNGKFAQTRVVAIRYRDVAADPTLFSNKVEEIFSRPANPLETKRKIPAPSGSRPQEHGTSKVTHPFFLGKSREQPVSGLAATPGTNPNGHTTDHEDPAAEVQKPVAWKDIVFKSNKPALSRDLQLEKPSWPPLAYQHVRPDAQRVTQAGDEVKAANKRKAKARGVHVGDDENLLSCFTREISRQSTVLCDTTPPRRLQAISRDAIAGIIPEPRYTQHVQAVSAARVHALNNLSSFDRAEASGPLPWTHRYGPTSWEQVLQPQCFSLYEWLRTLAVHNVKQGLDSTQSRPAPKRRKKLKKRDDGLDDFIVNDDQYLEPNRPKNAIMIVGPNGCGKTASVYAVAKQLGFEVFEIHAGMRRSQKDIFDKVGDMAQNHMVQGGQQASRDSSVVNETDAASSQAEPAQPSVAALLTGSGKKKALQSFRAVTPQSNKEQKQSLILFEEVDHIFEDDRGFWTGVQSLIQNSKRPVVLTCNDLQKVPLAELELHTTVTFVAPQPEVVSEYLTYIAAAEGHLIRPQAIESLYRSKGCDLRATMSELDFWCQMTVGSEKCGLDWFPNRQAAIDATDQPRQRIFSQNTFHEGLDLLPEVHRDLEQIIDFVGTSLDMPMDGLLESGPNDLRTLDSFSMQQSLDDYEVMSIADILDVSKRPLLYTPTAFGKSAAALLTNRAELASYKVASQDRQKRRLSFTCLEPLNVERPVFPPAQGRLAPSLDLPRSVLAAEIAPYVRTIASFDLRLEQQRDELFSSQGKKTRTTRAARAAAEGGEKANTRRERWFPPNLDLDAVLRTGNDWPQWLEDKDEDVEQI